MKTICRTLAIVLLASAMMTVTAQNNYRTNHDFYYGEYLDLRAVVTVFSQSNNLVDFEQGLNDYRNPISNLDLNNDGFVDYLRVIKITENREHVIIIQAVLGRDFYQDVATIIVGRDRYNREYIQFIGDPYLYGHNYVIEPNFHWRPRIVRWLWSSRQVRYISPYYYGYFPQYYRYPRIVALPVYVHNTRRYVEVRHVYHFVPQHRPVSVTVINNYSRADYSKRHPERDMRNRTDSRNENVRRDQNTPSSVNPSQTTPRREATPQQRVTPGRETPAQQEATPRRETTPARQEATPARETTTPRRETTTQPQRAPQQTPAQPATRSRNATEDASQRNNSTPTRR